MKQKVFLLESALIMAKLSCMPYAGHRAYQMIILIRKRRKIPFPTKNAFCYTLYHILVKGETFEDKRNFRYGSRHDLPRLKTDQR